MAPVAPTGLDYIGKATSKGIETLEKKTMDCSVRAPLGYLGTGIPEREVQAQTPQLCPHLLER